MMYVVTYLLFLEIIPKISRILIQRTERLITVGKREKENCFMLRQKGIQRRGTRFVDPISLLR